MLNILAIFLFILLEAVPLTAHNGLFPPPAASFELLSNNAALEATFLRLGSLRSILLGLPGGASLLLLEKGFQNFVFFLLKFKRKELGFKSTRLCFFENL